MNRELTAKEMLLIGLLFIAIATFWKSAIGTLIGIVGFLMLVFAALRWARHRKH
jgi:hypothetical protein